VISIPSSSASAKLRNNTQIAWGNPLHVNPRLSRHAHSAATHTKPNHCVERPQTTAPLTQSDAPTRAAVAPVQSGEPEWLHISEPGGAR